MKNLVPIILIFVISYNVYSQDRKIKKIESLYMEEDWQNCKNKAEKYLEKNKKNPVLYFYSGFSYFNIYLNSSDKKKNSLLKSAAKAIQKGVKYDKSGDIHKKFEEISNKMQNTLKIVADSLYDKGKNSKTYYQYLVRIYKDTTQQYRELCMKKPSISSKIVADIKSGKINVTDENGLKQGKWTKIYKNGKVAYEVFFKDNKPIGEYIRYNESGRISVLLNYDETGYARASLYDNAGKEIAKGFYKGKEKDSVWIYFEDNKNISKKHHKKDLLHGNQLENKTIIRKEHYKKNLLHGKQQIYYKDGKIYDEKYWVNGVEHGEWKKYYKNGNLRLKAKIVNGKLNGTMIRYYSNGGVEVIGFYKDDKPEKEWKYFSTKGKKQIIKYKNGLPENYDEIEKKQSDNYKKTLEMSKYLVDPSNYRSNPEEYMRRSGR